MGGTLVLLWLGLAVLPLRAEFRTWTNEQGVKLEAEFVKAEGGNVTLRLRNGKTSTFSETKLSAADREFMAAQSALPETLDQPEIDTDRKAKWLSKMGAAKKEAEETGLPVLVLFTGTDWCPYCVKLENEVFSKKEFKEFANKKLVLLKFDFEPGGKGENRESSALAKEFGVSGFPTYFLVDAKGAKLGKGGYSSGISPEKFASWVDSAVRK